MSEILNERQQPIVRPHEADVPAEPHCVRPEAKRRHANMPPIVCLCGSTRFVDTFNEYRAKLTHEGKIVLSIEIVTTQARNQDPQHVNPELKAMLDELHLRKIDLATEVLVLNVNGYIGESTRREVEYALAAGKPLTFIEPVGNAGCVDYEPPA